MNEQGISTEGTGSFRRAAFLTKGPEIVRSKLQNRMYLVPGFVTVVGFFCGFLGAMAALRGDFEYATKCIAIAIVFDGLDGRVARRLNATSEFGREFDSLSDLVAFGVTPGLLVYLWAFKPFIDDFGILVAFVYVVCGAARLARFNITTSAEPKKHFDGLPIPGAAAAAAAVVYCWPAPLTNWYVTAAMAAYMIVLAFLMVSTIPFYSVKHLKFTHTNARYSILGLAVAVAFGWYHARLAILFIATAYALSGPMTSVARRWLEKSRRRKQMAA